MTPCRHRQVSHATLGLIVELIDRVGLRVSSVRLALVVGAILARMWPVFGRLTTTVGEGRVECRFRRAGPVARE